VNVDRIYQYGTTGLDEFKVAIQKGKLNYRRIAGGMSSYN
jgi:hypothetical protein